MTNKIHPALAMLHLALDPHEMTGDACQNLVELLIDSKQMKRRDAEVHVEKFRTTNDCKGVEGYDPEVENRCMDVLDVLEKMRREKKESTKQLRKRLDQETKWRQSLGEEVVTLRALVIELEDKLDPKGAPQRAADRAMRQAMADQETRALFYGSGTSTEIRGCMNNAKTDEPDARDTEGGWSVGTGVIRDTPDGLVPVGHLDYSHLESGGCAEVAALEEGQRELPSGPPTLRVLDGGKP